jgi:very-short-patch-repair endonuclease
MTTDKYIETLKIKLNTGSTGEHSYRGPLEALIQGIVADVKVINEPKRQACGAPDYIILRNVIEVGYIETKDIGDADLEGKKKNKEQFDRYKKGLPNIIFTDYLTFFFYTEGQLVSQITIGQLDHKKIIPKPENFAAFENLIKDFCIRVTQTIRSPKRLADLMAGKAKLLADVIARALISDVNSHENSTLKDQMNAFKELLIHDITPGAFADVYAQTIAYGMFAARLHDPTLPTFSRQEAAELIPKSNPFLRKLFGYIAGPDIDDRIKWIVDSLVEIFLACNVEEILKNYGKTTKLEDPIIHFYETFLSEYDPKLRKARGVWYTPAPVVNFIVRAIDDILKTEFDLPQGLADTTKIKIKVNLQGKQVEQEVHKVQILDPATGTGTFLAEVVKHIHKKFEGQQGIWSNYVETHLLPRLNGFELLMASYAMAHLKLDLLLTETGYKPTTNQRFRVYLTNSLEDSHPDTGTLFASWLSTEANEANHIKRDTPVMCVIGNPPYSGISSNNGEWISKLIEDYKYVDGVHFNERKHWLNDDYVKFLRYGQHFIEKNGSGVLAFINPHGFLDNPTFRGMRWHLLKTYDKIYTIDLHGNSKKKEKHPDGSADVNVFDIMQGVAITVFVKTGKKKANELGKVFHFDLFGKREMKYDFLSENSLQNIDFLELKPEKPYLFFVPKSTIGNANYDKGFKVDEIFSNINVGFVTAIDGFNISMSINESKSKINDILNLDENAWRLKYNRPKDAQSWQYKWAKTDAEKHKDFDFQVVNYRPFDNRWTLYTGNSGGLYARPSLQIMKQFLKGNNIGLALCKQFKTGDNYYHAFISNRIFESSYVSNRTSEITSTFPLYLYPETSGQQTIGQSTERTPNLNTEIVKQIAEKLGIPFEAEKSAPLNLPKGETFFNPLPLEGLGEATPHYQTANARSYRFTKEFQEELKKNPTDAEKVMWELLRNKKTGHKIRRQHIIDDFITDFVCLRKNLVIEIDGNIHLQQKEYDELRSARLNELGYDVIRFTNEEVFENAEFVVSKIKQKLDSIEEGSASLNLSKRETTGANSSPPLEGSGEPFAPIDILDYIYAVLHSPTYREKYKEFLKIDFPRVPYPKDKDTFWQLVKLGGEIRQIHLLESPVVEKFITQYPIDGDNVVTKPKFVNSIPSEVPKVVGKVYINDTQYFANVPLIAWEFYIGGYQPAQKWLKDRKERRLEFGDILHYQKIIVALMETHRLMQEIDTLEFE